MSAENGASDGGLRDGEQIGRKVGMPAGEEPLTGGLTRPEAVVPIELGDAREAAAGGVEGGACSFKREAVSLGGAPVDSAKTCPLR